MKKLLLIVFAALSIHTIAQTNTFPSSGNVGIGVINAPSATLQIGSGTAILHYGKNGVLIKFNTGDRALLELHSPDGQNRLVFQSLSYATYLGSLDLKPLLLQSGGGNVGIGTTNPDQKLTVKGKIHAEEVIVDLNVPVADYVFHPTYKLMPLPEVEQFVTANSHLPEIPSAAEITKNGLSMGEMQNKLLQKVEELTLYAIQQDQSKKELEAKLAKQENQYNALLEKVEMLTKQMEKK